MVPTMSAADSANCTTTSPRRSQPPPPVVVPDAPRSTRAGWKRDSTNAG